MANLKKGSTYDGYTIANKKDLIAISPKALSLQTGGTNNGKYVKIASAKLTSQYAITSSSIDIVGCDNGGGTYQLGTIFFRVKQQLTLGNAPIVDLDLRNPVNMSATDVVAILSENDSIATIVDLYVKINFTYEILQAQFRNTRYPTYLTPCSYSQFFTALPTGTQFPCVLVDGVFNNLTMGGKTVLNTDHTSAVDPHPGYSKKVIGYTTNSSGTSGQYALIGTATITAQYQLAEAFIQFMSGASGNSSTQRGLLHFRVKQQAVMGSAPVIEMWLMNSNNFSPADIVAIVTSNTSSQTVVQLYAKINNTFEELYFNTFQELTLGVRSSVTIAWSTQSALIASSGSLPAGTQITASYQQYVLSGTTANRPIMGLYMGIPYFDTTLGQITYWNGTNWVDATGSQNIALARVSDMQITSTSATSVATLTPTIKGNFEVKVYYRVVTAATNLTITVSYTDGSGAQVETIVSGNSQAVGSYSDIPIMINATTATPITVTATAGTANQVYVSCTIKPE